jgi:hypothetical protein
LHIDLMLPLALLESGAGLEEMVRQIELTAATLPEVDTVRVCFQV